MPQALPAIAAAWAAVSTAAVAVGTALTFGSGIMAGLTAWSQVAMIGALGAALLMKPPGLGSNGQQVNIQMAGPNAALPLIFGRTGTQGIITYRGTYGQDARDAQNSVLTVEHVLSVGPVAEVQSFSVMSRGLTFSGDPKTGLATVIAVSGVDMRKSKLFRENGLKVAHKVGAHDDTSTLSSITGDTVPGITSADTMQGLARTILRCKLDEKRLNFPDGYPDDPISVVKGVLCYDPRLDDTQTGIGGSGDHRVDDPSTHEWSENPYIVALNFALGWWTPTGTKLFGIGAELDMIDVAGFAAAANVADANDWTVGGQVTSADGDWAIITNILAAGGGIPIDRAGKLSCFVRAPKVSTFTLEESDVLGARKVTTSNPMSDRANRIVPSCRQENQKWEMIAGEAVSNPSWIEQDGGNVRTEEISFPLVNGFAQAHQLAAYYAVDSREFLEFEVNAKPRALAVDVGDCIEVNLPEFEDGKTWIVMARTWDPANKTVALTLKAETFEKHAFCLGQSQVAPEPPTLTSFDPTNPQGPDAADWAVVANSITQVISGSSATIVPAIVIAGEVRDPNVATIIVETREPIVEADVFPDGTGGLDADDIQIAMDDFGWTQVAEVGRTASEITVAPLRPITTFDVSVRYQLLTVAQTERLILDPVTTAMDQAGAVRPGGVEWDPTSPTSPIANVPNALVTDANGMLSANTVAHSGVSIASIIDGFDADFTGINADVTQVQSDLANAIYESNSVLIGALAGADALIAQATTFRDQASANAAVAFTQAGYAAANATSSLTGATNALANATLAATRAGYAASNASATQTSAIAAAANAALADTARANTIIQRDAAITAATNALNNAVATAGSAGYAATNATSAQTSAGYAGANATISQTQAGYAGANASLAASNATLAATYSGYALANAAASNTSRGYAVSNATLSQTQAGYATSNAATAQTQSTLASSYATQAGSNATAAQTSAGVASTQSGYATSNAATAAIQSGLSATYASQALSNATAANTSAVQASSNASIATTQAGYATSNAAIALTQSTLSATLAGYAGSNAVLASTQAGYATSNAAIASSNATLTVSYASEALSRTSELLPSRFTQRDFWSLSYTGPSESLASLASSYVVANPTFGTVCRFVNQSNIQVYQRGLVATDATRVIEVEVRAIASVLGAAAANIRPYLRAYRADGTYDHALGMTPTTITAANTVTIATGRVAETAATGISSWGNATTAASVRFAGYVIGSDSTIDILSVTVRDVTAVVAAETQAARALANATIATTQSGYATANAALASTSATLSATHSGYAASNASISSTQAGYSTANAAVATTQAGLSTTFAGYAATNATAAQTQAGYSTSNASIASTQAGYSSANAAVATTQAGLSTTFAGYASTNATAAQTQASYSTSNASIASTQAGYASANASLASTSATLSATFAGYAGANATAAQTQAGYSAANATVATNQAGFATSNASLATSQATLSATFAGYANANAASALAQAGYSAANATLASTQAGYANSNSATATAQAGIATTFAGYATANAGAAATHAGYAASNAGIASTQATYSSANASLAATNATLSATFAGYANSNAAASLTQAGYSAANAVISSAQAGFSTSNAALAASNATLSATFAGYANANAGTAATQAGYSAANAVISSAQAGYSTSNAALAASNATLSATFAGYANANAGTAATQAGYSAANATLATTQAGYSTANAALAQSNSTLAATFAGYASANATSAQTQAGYSASNAVISSTQSGYATSNASIASTNATLSATRAGYALANATSAQTQAGYSAANATISTTQAGYASANATFAATNATLSATYSGYAAANATAADTARGYSVSNATLSTTQAGYSTANAAVATTQAGLSTTFAGYAATNATSAQTQAGYSAANATIATTQAGYASANAAFASTNSTLSATRAGYAQTNATVATTQAGYASANAALASASASVSASLGSGNTNPNSRFSDWSSTNPANWSVWTPANGTLSKVPGRNGSPNAARLTNSGSGNVGLVATQSNATITGGEYVVLSVEVTLVSGSFQGAAVYFDARSPSASVNYIVHNLAAIADASGVVRGAGTVGETYRYSILRDARGAAIDRYDVIACNRWSGFSPGGSAVMDWHVVGWRPATPEEIAAGVALPAATANVTTLQTAVAGLNASNAIASWSVTAAASGGLPTRIALASSTYGSNIALMASEIYFGANTVFDDATDTMRTTVGSSIRVIAFGAAFGTDGTLTEWEGPSSTAFASMSRVNAYFYRSNTSPYVGGASITPTFKVSQSATSRVGTRVGAGSATSSTVTLTPTGHTGSVTYTWTNVFGDSTVSATASTSAATAFSATVSVAQTKQAQFAWTATDSGSGITLTGYCSGTIIETT